MTNARYNYDVVVIGAGPAGLHAAAVALRHGVRVALIDDNPRPGGQIWRQGPAFDAAKPLKSWLDEHAQRGNLTLIGGARVVAVTGDRRLLIERELDAPPIQVQYERLILATGAREKLLPFDGWTLPGVTGAGGLQALIKGGIDVRGERIVVAGSGPLLLASAATAIERGANVVGVIEQAPLARVLRFGASLVATPDKLMQAAKLMRTLTFARYRVDAVVSAAQGSAQVESVTVRAGGREQQILCDRLAIGYGLVPNVTLAQALGCKVDAQRGIAVDDLQRTSVAAVFAAGECTGIGGMELASAEGALAAYAALDIDDAGVSAERHARTRWRRFAARLDAAFELGDAARALASKDTILCRCEDVTVGAVAIHANWRDAKLHTRCGMGACQGRVCGAAAATLFDWDVPPPRPPFSPARIETLMATGDDGETLQRHFDESEAPL